jgi:hypothetical protein
MGYKPMTKAAREGLRAELRAAADAARSVDVVALATRYGISPNSLRGIASRMGVPISWQRGTLLQRIMLLAHASKTVSELAEELGDKPEKIARAIRHARDQGVIVPHRNRLARSIHLQLALKPYALPPEIEQWLTDQLPSEASLIDLLRGIIIDAYHEEMDD